MVLFIFFSKNLECASRFVQGELSFIQYNRYETFFVIFGVFFSGYILINFLYFFSSENRLQQKSQINLQNKKKKPHHKKITGFQVIQFYGSFFILFL